MTFSERLNSRINEYFESKGISPFADSRMWGKILFWAVAWSSSWYFAVIADVPTIWRIFFGLLHILSHILIALNIAHDANHSAISSRRWVNRLLSYSFDLVGGSSLAWRLTHNTSHHGYINVEGYDVGADGRGLVRFTANAPWKPVHRYQHLYSPFLYCAVVLNVIFVKDLLILLSFIREKMKLPLSEYILFFAFKIFYVFYMLVVPTILLPYSFLEIAAVFVLGQMISGQFLIFIQMGHLNEFAEFPEPLSDKALSRTTDIDVMRTTCDFGPTNRFGSWFLGCINVHSIHHLRADICHVHYPDLIPIVIETAKEYGVPYVSDRRILRGYVSHYKLLRILGQQS